MVESLLACRLSQNTVKNFSMGLSPCLASPTLLTVRPSIRPESSVLPLLALLFIAILIWFLGSGSFGRAQTQAWIDRARARPGIYDWLNRHHGKFRASAHYLEFGGLFLIVYWCWDSWFAGGEFGWHPWRAVIIGVTSAIGAYLDEVHQLRSGTRQFRRVDFLHSLCGISLAALIIFYQAWIREM